MAKKYIVRYKGDATGNHTVAKEACIYTHQQQFDDRVDALHFMGECSTKITNIFVISCPNSQEAISELLQAQEEREYVNGL